MFGSPEHNMGVLLIVSYGAKERERESRADLTPDSVECDSEIEQEVHKGALPEFRENEKMETASNRSH
jgi:hypothetical protein